MRAGTCSGVFRLCLKLNQAACLVRRTLEQSRFYQGTHLEVKGLVVRGMAVRAALEMDVVRYRSISDAEEKDVGGKEKCDRGEKTPIGCQNASVEG